MVLGDDGMIPASMVASGGNMNVVSYSSWAAVITAAKSGQIPIYANAYFRIYANPNYRSVLRVTAIRGDVYYPYMPVDGTIFINADQYVARSISKSYIMYQDNTVGKLKQVSLSEYTMDNIEVVWSD